MQRREQQQQQLTIAAVLSDSNQQRHSTVKWQPGMMLLVEGAGPAAAGPIKVTNLGHKSSSSDTSNSSKG
jgi:hypothetical protein